MRLAQGFPYNLTGLNNSQILSQNIPNLNVYVMLILTVKKFDILSHVIKFPHNCQPRVFVYFLEAVLVSFQIATWLVLTSATGQKYGINVGLMQCFPHIK